MIDAASQTDASWQLNSASGSTMFNGVAGIDSFEPSTVWPFNVQDAKFNTFDRGNINQVSGCGDEAGTALAMGTFDPAQFNSNNTPPNFTTLDPIIYWWSDGGRRLFIAKKTLTEPGIIDRMEAIPFDVQTYNVSPNTTINNPTLLTTERFWWIKQIGASGLLLAGTNKGVVGLG
jgi:hypothetical protein